MARNKLKQLCHGFCRRSTRVIPPTFKNTRLTNQNMSSTAAASSSPLRLPLLLRTSLLVATLAAVVAAGAAHTGAPHHTARHTAPHRHATAAAAAAAIAAAAANAHRKPASFAQAQAMTVSGTYYADEAIIAPTIASISNQHVSSHAKKQFGAIVSNSFTISLKIYLQFLSRPHTLFAPILRTHSTFLF
jgi:hypothetical protein